MTSTTKNSGPDAIPATMKRLVVTAPGPDVASCQITVEEVPVPVPASDEVLVRVVAAAVNPSDYGSWVRCKPEQCPFAMGKEGCGIVVQSGGGLTTELRCSVGTKVGFVGLRNKQGAFAQYVTAKAMGGIFPMPDDVPIEDAASFFINPYTALAILDTVKSAEGSKSFIHTAAASQLGQMLVKVAASEGIEIINVVRRDEQASLLKELGAKHVVVSAGESWKEELRAKVDELQATVAFDAVAGTSPSDLMEVLPEGGTVYVYGGLAGKVQEIDPIDLIYKKKKLKGFFLTNWVTGDGNMLKSVYRMIPTGKKVNCGLKDGGWSSTQFKDTTMENVQKDLVELMKNGATGQKLRVRLDTI
jgi:NADPH:quinone reductase